MRWTTACILFTFLFLTLVGSLQAQDIPDGKFAANRFAPATGAGNYVMVDGALVGGHLTPAFGAMIDYSHRPLVLFVAECTGDDDDDCELANSQKDIVAYALTTNLHGALTLSNRFQVSLMLPLVLTSGDSYQVTTGPGLDEPYVYIPGGTAFGVGDIRLGGKVQLVGEGTKGFMLAAKVYLTAPLGNAIAENRGIGHDGLTVGGHLALEHRLDRLRFAANRCGVYRPKRELLSTEVGSEITYAVAASFDATSLLSVLGEVTGATGLSTQVDENPLEARVGAMLKQGDLTFGLAAGAGLVPGVGTPNFRAIASASFQPQGLDSDSDGVRDEDDLCPAEVEDFDGYLDEDGCPEADNDADGLEDGVDQCPDEPEDKDGFEDSDGCPDRDNDGDGIEDGYDSCPDEKEDVDGDRDDDGCRDNDRDRDGVSDDADKCPDEPEDTDGFGDEDGCPEEDFDGDGLPDDDDQCPDEVEDMDGFEDEDGCPEEGEGTGTTRTRERG